MTDAELIASLRAQGLHNQIAAADRIEALLAELADANRRAHQDITEFCESVISSATEPERAEGARTIMARVPSGEIKAFKVGKCAHATQVKEYLDGAYIGDRCAHCSAILNAQPAWPGIDGGRD